MIGRIFTLSIAAKASLLDPKAVMNAARKLGQIESENERGPAGERLGVY
jgi:hypothetical protein